MTVAFSDINMQALQLSADDKRALIENLVISLDGDPDANPEEVARAWDVEIAHRIEEMDNGEVESIDGDEVFARNNALLAPRA